MNRGIEGSKVNQVRVEKRARFMRRLGRKSLLRQFAERPLGANVKDATFDRAEGTAFEDDSADFDLSGLAGGVACKNGLLSIVEAGVGEVEDVGSNFGKRIEVEPLNERGELAVFFKNVQFLIVLFEA